ncbi:MAG TPA: hypothetical protein VGM31_14245 [Puia sp.]
MSVNVLGGSLEFDAILTTGDLQSGIAAVEGQIQKTIDSFANLAEKSGESLDQMKAKLAELEKQEETLRVAIDQATDPAMIKQYNAALADTVSQMKVLQQAIAQVQDVPAVPQVAPTAPAERPDLTKEEQQVEALYAQLAKLNGELASLTNSIDQSLDPKEVEQFNVQVAETVARMKQLQSEIQAIQDSGPISDTEKLKQLEAELQILEKQAARFRSSLSNAINPELIAQYNKGLDDTQAKMRAIYIQLDAIEHKEDEALKTPPVVPPVTPPTTPTEPVQPGGKDEEVQVVEKKILAYQRLQQLRNQLASMDKNDPAFKATYDEAVKLQGQINNVNRSLQLTSRNVVGIEALTQGARALVGAFQAYNGILGLTTEDQEQLQKSVTEVVSAMGVLNGIQEIAAVLDKNSSLNIFLQKQFRKDAAVATTEQAAATEVLAGAQEAEAVATGEAAVAQETLNVAMESNPVGIILLALTAIVVALQAYASGQKDATEQQTKANEAAAEAADTLAKLVDQYRQVRDAQARSAADAVSLAQAQGQSEQAVLGLKLKQLEAEKTANSYALAQLGYSSEVYADQQATLQIRLEELQALQSVAENGGELSSQSKERLALLQAQIKALEAQINPTKALIQANETLNAQIASNNAERDKKAYDASLKSAQAVADAKLLVDRKYTAQALADQVDAIKASALVELNNPNLTSGEQFKIQQKQQKDIQDATREYQAAQLRSAQDFADARLLIDKKYTKQSLDDQIAAIKARTQVDLANPDLLPGQQAKILAQQKKDIDDANREYKLDQLNAQRDTIEAQLALVKEGSAEELSLKLRLIQTTSAAEIVEAQDNDAKIAKITAARAKASADLTTKYSLDAAEAEAEATVAGTNAKLAVVQKGSEQELALKKQLVADQAALDTIQAQERTKNEDTLAAKILKINAKSAVDKKKIDDNYYDTLLQRQLKVIANETSVKNAPLQAIINNPFSTNPAVEDSQRQQFQNDIEEIQKQLDLVSNNILQQRGDLGKLEQDLAALKAKKAAAQADLNTFDQKIDYKNLQTYLQGISSLSGQFKDLGSSLKNINPELADLFDRLGSITDVAGKAAKAILSFVKGGPTGIVDGVIAGIGAIVSLISTAFSDNDEMKQQVAEMQNQVIIGEVEITRQYDLRLVDQAKLNQLRLQGIKDEQQALQQQARDTQSEFNDLLVEIQKLSGTKLAPAAIGNGLLPHTFSLAGLSYDELNELFLKGELSDKAKELFQELQQLKQDGADVTQALADAKDQLDQIFTGTTSDDISASIIDGFKQGKRGAEDFADDFQELMTNALLSSLQSQTLEPALQQFYEQFSDFSQSDNVLTSAEIEQLQKQYNDIINNAATQFQQLQQIAGTNLAGNGASTNSLAGAIKGITEDQAELLAGQFGGLRITAIDQLKVAQQNLDALNIIVDNTGNLLEMRAILRRLELNGIKIQ